MKFFISDHYYPPVIAHFYAQNPTLKTAPYQKQLHEIINLKFGTADFYSRNLRRLGHQAEDYIINALPLQDQWARENPASFWEKIKASFRPITTWERQVRQANPDVIYCQNLSFPGSSHLPKIKRAGQLVVGQIASLTDWTKDYLAGFDLMITSFPHYVDRYRQIGLAAEYLPLGFENGILALLPSRKIAYGVVFIGNLTSAHQNRRTAFDYLARKMAFHLWGYGWENLPEKSPLRRHLHLEPAWGLPMYAIYRQSAIVVNRHIDAAENFANNMRLYEATGVGAMLITDAKDNLGELFKIGQEVETYASKEELVDKVKYFLKHSLAREKIARAGQRRTLRQHTYRRRMTQLVAIINKYR